MLKNTLKKTRHQLRKIRHCVEHNKETDCMACGLVRSMLVKKDIPKNVIILGSLGYSVYGFFHHVFTFIKVLLKITP